MNRKVPLNRKVPFVALLRQRVELGPPAVAAQVTARPPVHVKLVKRREQPGDGPFVVKTKAPLGFQIGSMESREVDLHHGSKGDVWGESGAFTNASADGTLG